MLLQENTSIILWIIIFIVMGTVSYILDRWLGIEIYRWFYGMTHKDPLPQETVCGIIHGQKAKVKFSVAACVALILSFVTYWSEGSSPIKELLSWFIEVPLVMIGFYLGPVAWNLWNKKDALFSKVDELENGKIDITQQIMDVTSSVAKNVISQAEKTFGEAVEAINKNDKSENKEAIQDELVKAENQAEKEERKKEENTEIDPQDYLNKYLKK